MGEPVALYMPLGGGDSNAYRLVFAEPQGGDIFRLLDEQPADEAWLFPGASTVFAVEQQRPGMLVVVAVQEAARDESPPEPAAPALIAPHARDAARVLRIVCLSLFCAALAFFVTAWCFGRPPLPLHPSDPLRLGVLATGMVVLWWAQRSQSFQVSKGAVALLSIPPSLLSASIVLDLLFW